MKDSLQVFSYKLMDHGRNLKNLVLLNSDSLRALHLDEFGRAFEGRCFNFGMGVENMVSTAQGLVVRGKMPVIAGYCVDTIASVWEQIRNDICYPNLNVKIIGVYSGFTSGKIGTGYQILEDIALMSVLPNMKIACPADAFEIESVLNTCFSEFGPCYIRLPVGKFAGVTGENEKFEFGKSKVVRDGNDICIFTMGPMLHHVLEVADILESENIGVRVVNLSSIKPIDKDLIVESSKGVGFCASIEDHSVIGGLGGRVAEVLSEYNPVRFFRIGMEDRFGESASVEDLYKKYSLDTDSLVRRLKQCANM